MKKIFFLIVLVSALFSNENSSYSTNEDDTKKLSFIVGTSFSYLYWRADNKVEDENKNNYGNVDYDIGNSLYKGVYLQGKYDDQQLAISYIRNEMDKKGTLKSKVSSFLVGYIDFSSRDNFLNFFDFKEPVLRLLVEKADINGIATYDGEDINGVYVGNREFTTKYLRINLLNLSKKGEYTGLEYTNYTMPSLVGFSKDGDVKFVFFDPKVKISKLSLQVGYDALNDIKNNYDDYRGFYLQAMGGVGLAYVDISNDEYAEKTAKEDGYSGVDPISIAGVIDYGLDVGYIIQSKSKMLNKLGITIQMGLKLKGTYFGAGTTSENSDDGDNNEVSLEFERDDRWYGPYITLNLVF